MFFRVKRTVCFTTAISVLLIFSGCTASPSVPSSAPLSLTESSDTYGPQQSLTTSDTAASDTAVQSRTEASLPEISSAELSSEKISSVEASSFTPVSSSTVASSERSAASELCLTLSSAEVRSGDALVFRIDGFTGDPVNLRAYYSETSSRQYHVYAGDGFLFGIAPVNSTASKLGKLIIADSDTGQVLVSAKVALLPRTYERQDLTVEPGSSMEASGSSQNLESDKAVIRNVTASPAQELLFTGSFIMPVNGRISTQYGQRRYTNGKYSSAHSGFDIAAAEGTPVMAAGSGKVVFAGELKFYGNTVIIDHGLGIYSFYNHMSMTAVDDNQPIQTGQQIGEVGSTGYSTGPHLHFNVSVGGTNVDPELFISGDGDSIYQQLERMISQ